MIGIKITNWKDMVDQFGLTDTYMGLKSARQISTQMRKELEDVFNWKTNEPPEGYTIRCNTDSEAICTFKRVYYNKDKNIVTYEYTGTAN